MRTDEIAAITGEDDPVASLLHKIVNQVRAFVDTCDIDNYESSGEMAQEAEDHRRRFGKYLIDLDELRDVRQRQSWKCDCCGATKSFQDVRGTPGTRCLEFRCGGIMLPRKNLRK